ncbi:hypothetical protein FEDK69T_02790 [Flavobacterium enshiense DK69]|uniref:DUF4349 domain-containing protein n=1 Tax=Flavobacterium enshiense DK69 TaxID=1107311 RepID=V6SEQ6_9FLAO|nr:DUF4349 domain-containing protein [Flavobacterium enshiense]ESU24727.1 hypothetical protein FEDK69T_02790 [Flavobacterium enshiense DK69]KGO96815.1 hypothetical protein Q767_03675 [Flavobacterium enshiense DK69]
MKTVTGLGLALLVFGIAVSCKEKMEEKVDYAPSETTETVSPEVVSSSAAVEKKDSDRKFIRTAEIKFKVKNVAKSTYAIEDATTKFGGFVTYTNLQSEISERNETKVSKDIILETIRYQVKNDITIRVPNTKMDTVIKTIAKQIDFLDFRIIKADDVSLQLLANQMAQNRSVSNDKRLEKAIDTKGKKLNSVLDGEQTLADRKEQNDNSKLKNISLKDQVNFSTLNLQIYQNEAIKHEMLASEESIDSYRPHIGLQLWDSLKTGWYFLENIIAFIVSLWGFILILFGGYFIYKKYYKTKS